MPGPLPIVIGVTGHRDIRPEDVPSLEGIVKRLLDRRARITSAYARCCSFRRWPRGAIGWSRAWRSNSGFASSFRCRSSITCTSRTSRATRRATSSGACWPSRRAPDVLPLMSGNTDDGIAQHGEQRNRQYAQVARSDRPPEPGIPRTVGRRQRIRPRTDKVGGTGEVVRFRLEGIPTGDEPTGSPLSLQQWPRLSHRDPAHRRTDARTGADLHAAAADATVGGLLPGTAGLDGSVQRRRAPLPR